MPSFSSARIVGRPALPIAAGVALAGVLLVTAWLDLASTRREFDTLVHAQAASVRATVAAAARANRAASLEMQSALSERLLDNARLLAELNSRNQLTPALLATISDRNHLFRVSVVAANGSRELSAGGLGHPGGPAGSSSVGRPAGQGIGSAPGSAALLDAILTGARTEIVTDVHQARSGGARLAAGVRRAGGGAILVAVEAGEVATLRRQSSLDVLLADIVSTGTDVAYIVFEDDGVRWAHGAPDAPVPDTHGRDTSFVGISERELVFSGRPVLELTGPITLGDGSHAHLHLGMRLDASLSAERRTRWRLLLTLSVAAAVGVLALGLVWLHRAYGALSVEHARGQQALRRRDRLAAMGELASTVAHEIRNPLNAIAMSAQRLRREYLETAQPGSAADCEESRALVSVIQSEAQRINTKVQQFLEFARPPALQRRPMSLGPWIASIVAAMRPLATGRQVALEIVGTPGGDARIDPEQLRQAVDNLLRNAIEATPAGGSVTVTATSSAREATIEVRDTGSGINPDVLTRIFDLYFTTKAEGTGIGLALSQQIVSAHSGVIEVESTPGRGTSMLIRLPATSRDAAHA